MVKLAIRSFSMVKINMGCGPRDFGHGWIHIDGGSYDHLDYCSISDLSQFEDNSVDLIYSSHVIPYYDRHEMVDVFNEWKRVLKPGAILRLSLTDFETVSRLYLQGVVNLDNIIGPLYGRMPMGDTMIYEKTAYDLVSLKALLELVGFRNVKKYDWRETEHAHFDDHSQAYVPHMDKENGTLISLNVECVKRNKKRSNKQ